MRRKRVYPVWVMELINHSYYCKSFDMGVEAEGEILADVLEEIKDKIEKKAYFMEEEGLELPIAGSKEVDNKNNFTYMDMVTCNLDTYYKKYENIYNIY